MEISLPKHELVVGGGEEEDVSTDLSVVAASLTTADEEDEGYRTPMGEEYRIPKVLECPPAPRKRKADSFARRVTQFFMDETKHADKEETTVKDRIPNPEEEEDGYTTPTGEEHRIPKVLKCPPAPRKRRRATSFTRLRRPLKRVSPTLQDMDAFLSSLLDHTKHFEEK